jgi:acetyl-CoA acetyltransferase
VISKEKACIVGVGMTAFSKASGTSAGCLAVQAVETALEDAGLKVSDVDACVPFHTDRNLETVLATLQLNVRATALCPAGGAGSVGSLQLARALIEAGRAEVVAFWVARNAAGESPVAVRALAAIKTAHFRNVLEFPYGATVPVQWSAMSYRRHFAEFGTPKKALAEVALIQRANAQLNPHALMYGRPLSASEYESARLISDPYQLFDCSLETDGAAAIIVTSAERAKDCRQLPVQISGVAEARPQSPDDTVNRRDFFEIGLTTAAPRAFGEAKMVPSDVDAAMIYDPFTFEVIHQLEEAGFCDRGEGGEFVLSGETSRSGRLPVNTHGGLLSEGHAAGLNHIIEATSQLRAQCGERQVPNCEVVAVTGWTHYGDGGFALLTK